MQGGQDVLQPELLGEPLALPFKIFSDTTFSPDILMFQLSSPEKIATAHRNCVNYAVQLYLKHRLETPQIPFRFIFPLKGALALAYDISLGLRYASISINPSEFIFTTTVDEQRVFYNLHGQQIDAKAMADFQLAVVDEMFDFCGQLGQVLNDISPIRQPFAISPVGKSHTSAKLTELYQNLGFATEDLTGVGIFAELGDVNNQALWTITGGYWNSSFVSPENALLERVCKKIVGIPVNIALEILRGERDNPFTSNTYHDWLVENSAEDSLLTNTTQLMVVIFEVINFIESDSNLSENAKFLAILQFIKQSFLFRA